MRKCFWLAAALALSACQNDTTAPPQDTQTAGEDPTYRSAVFNPPERSAADRARDAARRPHDVLAFLGIGPSMKVLDLYSGGGYYSEILAGVVEPGGQVTAHNNSAYRRFAADEIAARYADDRLKNVRMLDAENNELELAPEEYDAVTMMLAYHDIYFVDADNGWPEIDGAALCAELFRGLKPGGIVGIVDHAAPVGSPTTTGGTTHRIDPGIVIAEMQEAGFVLEGEGDLLRNPEDDMQQNVFDTAIRGKTDRFVLRFRKP